MTNTTQASQIIAKILVGVFSISSAAFADCDKETAKDMAQSILVAASGSKPATSERKDRRFLISELDSVKGLSDFDKAAIRKLADSTVEITNARKDNELVNGGLTSAGFLIPTPMCEGAFVLTTRHTVNRKVEQMIDGEKKSVYERESVLGYRVDVNQNLNGSGKEVANAGTVIDAGTFGGNPTSDWVLVRLDRRMNVPAFPTAFASGEQIGSARMISLGFPVDLSGEGRTRQVVVDAQCEGRGKISGVEGIATTCIGTVGNSGGPVAALANTKNGPEWRVVGMSVSLNIDGVATGTSGANLRIDSLDLLSLNDTKKQINQAITKELAAKPCQ